MNAVRLVLLCLLAGSFWLLQACGNKCDKVQCQPNATCFDGDCHCDAGYEGANCDSLSAPKFLGTYQVGESCPSGGGGGTYNINIINGFDPAIVVITNIANTGLSVDAEVGGTTIVITEQDVGALTVEGQGFYEPQFRRLTLNVVYNQAGNIRNCKLTGFKQ